MIPNLDIDLMKTFLAIADTGGFTRAAEEVHKTQSAVSVQMKRLETKMSIARMLQFCAVALESPSSLSAYWMMKVQHMICAPT